MRITNAGFRESHVHDVTITKEAPNYRMEIADCTDAIVARRPQVRDRRHVVMTPSSRSPDGVTRRSPAHSDGATDVRPLDRQTPSVETRSSRPRSSARRRRAGRGPRATSGSRPPRYSWTSVNVGLVTSSRIEPEALGQAPHEGGLAGAEIARQQQRRRRPAAQPRVPAVRPARRVSASEDDRRSRLGHRSAAGWATRRRAVSSRMASPMWSARSPAIIDTSPVSASASSPAAPCR